MGKYEWIIQNTPKGVTHLNVRIAVSVAKRRGDVQHLQLHEICDMYRRSNNAWYKYIDGGFKSKLAFGGGIKCSFKLIQTKAPESKDIMSIDSIKVLANAFG